MEEFTIRPIAHIENDLETKFGVPRQAGIVKALEGRIVFEPEFRVDEALRGLEDFSHIWLIWGFDKAVRDGWSPTVRPPRLGGNERKGVFATRSPFRPNPLAMSCVELKRIERGTDRGSVLVVGGADLMNGTPVFDIKPYIPYADCVPEASCGFAPDSGEVLRVEFSGDTETAVPPDRLAALRGILENDPRPRYQNDESRVYGLPFAGLDVRFTVSGDVLTVVEIV